MQQIAFYLQDVGRLLAGLPVEQLEGLYRRLLAAYDDGRQVFLLGNGGSGATCSHMVNDLQKCLYLAGGRTLRALALTDCVPLLTAWANDTAYEHVFAEQLRPWVQPGDLVFCLSGSGNSPNVLNAARLARDQGAYVVGLSGYQGGKLAALVDESLVIPCDNMQRIEDCHMVILHVLFWRTMQVLEARKQEAPA
ncbi:MAG: SIS domain-containing protein [Armatimonadetes bacterium]|nr:SIS domain-containing protein [Armatimonadota bacterium]